MASSFFDFLQSRPDAPRTTVMRGPAHRPPVIRAATTKERVINRLEDLADFQTLPGGMLLGILTSLLFPARYHLDEAAKQGAWERDRAGLSASEIEEGIRNGTLQPPVGMNQMPDLPGKKALANRAAKEIRLTQSALKELERKAVRQGLSTGSLSGLSREVPVSVGTGEEVLSPLSSETARWLAQHGLSPKPPTVAGPSMRWPQRSRDLPVVKVASAPVKTHTPAIRDAARATILPSKLPTQFDEYGRNIADVARARAEAETLIPNASGTRPWIPQEELEKIIADPTLPVRSSMLSPGVEGTMRSNDRIMNAANDPTLGAALSATTGTLKPSRGAGLSAEEFRKFLQTETERFPRSGTGLPGDNPLPNVAESSIDPNFNPIHDSGIPGRNWDRPVSGLRHETPAALLERREALRQQYEAASVLRRQFEYPAARSSTRTLRRDLTVDEVVARMRATKAERQHMSGMRVQRDAIDAESSRRLPQETVDQIRAVMEGRPVSTPVQPPLNPQARTALAGSVGRLRDAWTDTLGRPELDWQRENIRRVGAAGARKLKEGLPRSVAQTPTGTISMAAERPPEFTFGGDESFTDFLSRFEEAKRLKGTGVELGTFRPDTVPMTHVDDATSAATQARQLDGIRERLDNTLDAWRKRQTDVPARGVRRRAPEPTEAILKDQNFYRSLSHPAPSTADNDLLGLTFSEYMDRLRPQRDQATQFLDEYNSVMNNPKISTAEKAAFNARFDIQDELRNVLDAFRRRGR